MAEEGVLLYYKYVDLIGEQEAVKDWYQETCGRLHLRGRIRVARDGVNVTVGPLRLIILSLRKKQKE